MNTRDSPDNEIHFCIDSIMDGNFRPARPVHRERETESLCLAARMHGNMLIRGAPGTGKTTVIKEVFERIRQGDFGIFPVYVNTRIHSSRYMIFSEIYVRLSGSGEYPVNQSFQKLEKAVARLIARRGCRLLVCLDDSDYKSGAYSLNNILHSLLRFSEIHDGAGIAVWMVVSDNSFNPESVIEKSVWALFSPSEVSFRNYDRDEMDDILRERIGPAMGKGILSEEVFGMIVDHARTTGDPRTGTGLFHRSAFAAAMQRNGVVTVGTVREQIDDAKKTELPAKLDSLPLREREIYGIIRELSAAGIEMAMTPVFAAVHERLGICYSLFFRAVNRLERTGLIRTSICTGRGRKRLIEIAERT